MTLLPAAWRTADLRASLFVLGLVLLPAYDAGSLAGRRLFDPAWALLDRATAHGLVGAAGVTGLPIWHG